MINPDKTGKFIADLRKGQGLTQEKLGDIIGINSKSISKWERGLSFPDSSHLCELSKILNVSVVEILNGEKIIEKEKKEKSDSLTIDGINLYSKKIKHKYITILLIFMFSFAFLMLSLFALSNYNKCKIYSISSSEENVVVNGYIIFNPYKKIILINNLLYTDTHIGTDKETFVKNVHVSLISNETSIYTKNDDSIGKNPIPISEYLNNYAIYLSEDVNDNTESIKVNQLNNLYLLVEYCDKENNNSSIRIKLNVTEEFKNTKLVY